MSNVNSMVESGKFVGQVVDTQELLEIIQGRYGDLDDNCGCYCDGAWLSVAEIVEMIVVNSYSDD